MNKVARVGLVFWMMKVCATTLGESGWVHAASTQGFALPGVVLVAAFVALLGWQLRAGAYQPLRYWTTVLATGALAAMTSDAMSRLPGPGHAIGTVLLAGAMVAVLAWWQRDRHGLAIDDVVDVRTEAFYWAAIVLGNALGTALADGVAAAALGLGTELLLLGALVTVIVLAAYFTHFDLAVLFWIAIVFTRPFGASFGDFLSGPGEEGGLALGTSGAALVLAVLLLAFLVHARAAALRARRWGR